MIFERNCKPGAESGVLIITGRDRIEPKRKPIMREMSRLQAESREVPNPLQPLLPPFEQYTTHGRPTKLRLSRQHENNELSWMLDVTWHLPSCGSRKRGREVT